MSDSVGYMAPAAALATNMPGPFAIVSGISKARIKLVSLPAAKFYSQMHLWLFERGERSKVATLPYRFESKQQPG
jgi:hypothetical protein